MLWHLKNESYEDQEKMFLELFNCSFNNHLNNKFRYNKKIEKFYFLLAIIVWVLSTYHRMESLKPVHQSKNESLVSA